MYDATCRLNLSSSSLSIYPSIYLSILLFSPFHNGANEFYGQSNEVVLKLATQRHPTILSRLNWTNRISSGRILFLLQRWREHVARVLRAHRARLREGGSRGERLNEEGKRERGIERNSPILKCYAKICIYVGKNNSMIEGKYWSIESEVFQHEYFFTWKLYMDKIWIKIIL